MSRLNITVLCEDKQHEAFIRRFLKKRNRRVYAVQRASSGAGDRFVMDKFPSQLDAVRRCGGILVTMIDGDNHSIERRLRQLDDVCSKSGVSPRKTTDKVVVFVPVRNIETWLAYLDGETVNETDSYPKLNRERECKRHVDALYDMCEGEKLRSPAPPSLKTACQEFRLLNDR